MKQRTAVIWALISVAVAGTAAIVAVRVQHLRARSILIRGAVIRRDKDTRKELPIAGATVTISNGAVQAVTQSDASGFFKLLYPPILWPGRIVDLSFRRDGYEPLDLKLQSGIRLTTRQLYVAAMSPLPERSQASANSKLSVVSNLRVRYTVNSENDSNIGSAVRTFQVVNKANQPCNHELPCSPEGLWKAAKGSATLDAGQGNEFRDVRASCIAGPCPFTRVDSQGFARGGRIIAASALDWSDTATFLVEAEVFRDSINSNVRELYPVIFGQALHFTLPPTQEGVSLEADIDGTPMVFPLGPDLFLSWANCTQRKTSETDQSTVYRCELKPGYRF